MEADLIERSGSAAFPRLLLRPALLQGGNHFDNIAAGRLGRRCLAFLSLSLVFEEVQRPLLTPDECLRMPSPQKDHHDMITAPGDMVVYCAGFPAIYGRQPLYFEDACFATR